MFEPQEIEQRLSAYLGACVADLRLLASGWETIIFEFRLGMRSASHPEIPVGRPLALVTLCVRCGAAILATCHYVLWGSAASVLLAVGAALGLRALWGATARRPATWKR